MVKYTIKSPEIIKCNLINLKISRYKTEFYRNLISKVILSNFMVYKNGLPKHFKLFHRATLRVKVQEHTKMV